MVEKNLINFGIIDIMVAVKKAGGVDFPTNDPAKMAEIIEGWIKFGRPGGGK